MSEPLVIKISADTKDLKDAYEEVSKKTEDLDSALGKIAKISGVAFAALAAQVTLSVKAFLEADNASRQLNVALQNQGIYSEQLKNQYKEYADEVQATTRYQADEVTQSQAVIQSYLGQLPVTKELTKSIADLAQAQGITLAQASEELGKAISQGSGALLREGLQFSINSNEAERYAQTLAFVQNRYEGAAAGANPLSITMARLQNQFHDSAAEIGAQFAPALNAAGQALLSFITPAKEGGEEATNLKVALITVGLALSAIGVGLPLVAQGFLVVRNALIALNVELTATKIALASIGIGLLIIALTELVLHFDSVSARIKVIVKGLADAIAGAFKGIREIISGALDFNGDKVKQGMDEIKDAFKEGWETATAEIPKATKKALEEHNNHLQKQTALDKQFGEIQLETKKELRNQGADFDADIDGKELKQIKATLETESSIKRKIYADELKQQVAAHNQTLLEEKKYGVAYAAIGSTLRSDEIQGTKKATGDLVALSQSKNETLKSIGKAASIAQIVIKTAEAAMNIYSGFSSIPFIGIALGAAGAAAAIAFGAEQISQVTAAASGGLVTGQGFSDNQPFLLTPGEIITPKQNFNELIEGVAQQRGYVKDEEGTSQGGTATVQLILKDNLMDFIETKLVQRRSLNLSIQGKS